jgi:hypothetical protein
VWNYLYISLICIEIVIGLLAHSESEDHYERTYVSDEKANFERLNELRECGDEEEEIKEKLELSVENFGYEGKKVVFGIFNKIILIILG